MGTNLLKTGCFLFLLLLIPLLTGCQNLQEATVKEGDTTIQAVPNFPASSDPGALDAVCNPFGGGATARDQGLEAELFHLPDSLPHYDQVSQYISNGTKLDATLYFDQVNVPTRPFDAGFRTLSGDTLQTPNGDTLYEWFAIRFRSVIKLTNADRSGKKQFALLADDGAVLKAQVDGNWTTVVDDDGTHPTRFKVATFGVDMNAQSELPVELSYYQGPRYHIAVMLLWRDLPAGTDGWKDSANGAEGNDLFFDSTTAPSEPQAAYADLLARGWSPVPAANFFLPGESAPNPCPEEEIPTETATATDTTTSTATSTATTTDTATDTITATATDTSTSTNTDTTTLAITGFDATTTTNSASIIWQTSGVPATTTVYWGTSASALSNRVSLGSSLGTVHQIEVTGLAPATGYYFQAESVDGSGHAVNSAILFKATK